LEITYFPEVFFFSPPNQPKVLRQLQKRHNFVKTFQYRTMSTDTTDKPQKLGGYEFLRSLGSPHYGVAPMVDASELPFRMLCRKYGADIAWTPMIHRYIFQHLSPTTTLQAL
jgi:hypothetical protein